MPTPTTKEEALDQCELLWKNLAETGAETKNAVDILGYTPRNACPACEWAHEQAVSKPYCIHMCNYCPIKAWNALGRDCFLCEMDSRSPYYKWLIANSAEDRQAAAKELLRLIAESR